MRQVVTGGLGQPSIKGEHRPLRKSGLGQKIGKPPFEASPSEDLARSEGFEAAENEPISASFSGN